MVLFWQWFLLTLKALKGKKELFTRVLKVHESFIYTDHYKMQSWEAYVYINKKIFFRANLNKNNKLHLLKSNMISMDS